MSSIFPIVGSNVLFAADLALLAILVTRFWCSPQLAHAMWALVLLKLITPPLAVVSIPCPCDWLDDHRSQKVAAAKFAEHDAASNEVVPPSVAVSEPPDVAAPKSPETAPEIIRSERASEPPVVDASRPPRKPFLWTRFAKLRFHWMYVVGVTWCVGGFVYALVLLRRFVLFQRVLAASCDPTPEIRSAASLLAAKLELTRCPPLRVVDAPIPPLVWSLGFRPTILLPIGLLNGLDEPQRDAVIAHELAHVRRRDDLVRWLEILTLVVFWWNPLAWFARRKLREAEEECCDAWVVWALPNERRNYGEAMLKTIEFLTDRPVTPVLAGTAFGSSFYKRRIEMIMKRNVNRKMSWSALVLVVAITVVVLPTAARTVEGGTRSEHLLKAVQSQGQELDDPSAKLLALEPAMDQPGHGPQPSEGSGQRESGQDGKPRPRKPPQPLEQLEGSWEVSVTKHSRVEQPIQWNFDFYRWRFDTKTMKVTTQWKRGDATGGGENRFTIDATKTPHHLTIYGDNMLIQAIFESDGKELKIAHFGKSEKGRPGSFGDSRKQEVRKDLGPRIVYVLKKTQSPVIVFRNTGAAEQPGTDDRQPKGQQNLIDLLREVESLQLNAYKAGQVDLEAVMKATLELLDAQLAAVGNGADRAKLIADAVKVAEHLGAMTEARFQANHATKADVLKARAFPLQIEAKAGRPADAAAQADEAKPSSRFPQDVVVRPKSGLPALDISPDADERRLQEDLLDLDVQAAETALVQTEAELQNVEQFANSGAVGLSKLRKLMAQRDAAQHALKRAHTILKLFQLKEKRLRDQEARRKTFLKQQQPQPQPKR